MTGKTYKDHRRESPEILICTININPFSAKPLSCVYVRNVRGYLLNLWHCRKEMPHLFYTSLQSSINVKNKLLSHKITIKLNTISVQNN
jgi:hypothetical protein